MIGHNKCRYSTHMLR